MLSGVTGRNVVERGDSGLVGVWVRSSFCCLVRGVVLLCLACVGFSCAATYPSWVTVSCERAAGDGMI